MMHDAVTRAISGHATPAMQLHYSTVRSSEVRTALAKGAGIATGGHVIDLAIERNAVKALIRREKFETVDEIDILVKFAEATTDGTGGWIICAGCRSLPQARCLERRPSTISRQGLGGTRC
jgi:hypothetical protein